MAEAGAPAVGGQGVTQIGPTVIVHGNEEQKSKYLSGILSGDVAWCQGYSEPGAGSDLASVQTRAVRDGDEYVLNGQKIWTSNAHNADNMYILVRTDPDAPKHRGISLIIIDDIHEAGVQVRPLIDMTFNHHFNETFFEDVRAPVSNRIGEENRGWYVGMTLLDYERSNIDSAILDRTMVEELVEYIGSDEGAGRTRTGDFPTLRAEVADRYIECDVARNFGMRIVSMQSLGRGAEPRGLHGQDVRHGDAPARDAHGHEDAGALRERLGQGLAVRTDALAVHARLRALDPLDDRGRQLGDSAQHHRHARARPAARLAIAETRSPETLGETV